MNDLVEFKSVQCELLHGGDGMEIAHYARFSSRGGNAQLLEAVIQSGDAEAMYYYAQHVAYADQDLLLEGIIGSAQVPVMIKYAVNLPGHEHTPPKDQDLILTWIQCVVVILGNPWAMCAYARCVHRARCVPIEIRNVVQDAVIASGNAKAMARFAKENSSSDRAKLQAAVVDSGDAKAMARFARTVPRANRGILQAALLGTGNAEAMAQYMRYVPGADKELLQAAIDKLEKPSCLT